MLRRFIPLLVWECGERMTLVPYKFWRLVEYGRCRSYLPRLWNCGPGDTYEGPVATGRRAVPSARMY